MRRESVGHHIEREDVRQRHVAASVGGTHLHRHVAEAGAVGQQGRLREQFVREVVVAADHAAVDQQFQAENLHVVRHRRPHTHTAPFDDLDTGLDQVHVYRIGGDADYRGNPQTIEACVVDHHQARAASGHVGHAACDLHRLWRRRQGVAGDKITRVGRVTGAHHVKHLVVEHAAGCTHHDTQSGAIERDSATCNTAIVHRAEQAQACNVGNVDCHEATQESAFGTDVSHSITDKQAAAGARQRKRSASRQDTARN